MRNQQRAEIIDRHIARVREVVVAGIAEEVMSGQLYAPMALALVAGAMKQWLTEPAKSGDTPSICLGKVRRSWAENVMWEDREGIFAELLTWENIMYRTSPLGGAQLPGVEVCRMWAHVMVPPGEQFAEHHRKLKERMPLKGRARQMGSVGLQMLLKDRAYMHRLNEILADRKQCGLKMLDAEPSDFRKIVTESLAGVKEVPKRKLILANLMGVLACEAIERGYAAELTRPLSPLRAKWAILKEWK